MPYGVSPSLRAYRGTPMGRASHVSKDEATAGKCQRGQRSPAQRHGGRFGYVARERCFGIVNVDFADRDPVGGAVTLEVGQDNDSPVQAIQIGAVDDDAL